jgi:hypothetical protein
MNLQRLRERKYTRMKTKTLKAGAYPLAALLSSIPLTVAHAQLALPPDAIGQFQHIVGDRVEAVTILGGDYGAAGGVYSFRGGDMVDLDIAKIGGGGIVADPKPLGLGGLQWAPVLQGNLGHMSAQNTFATGYLEGNGSLYDLLAVEAGGGARFLFNDHFSLTPTISGIYGHTENTFQPRNAVGDFIEANGSGTVVDWKLDTWSVVPSLEAQYTWQWKRTTFEFNSRYDYFHTESFQSTSPVIGVSGDSHTWENKLDVDVPLGWKLFERELHTGGFFSRTELFGGAAAGLNEDHLYAVNGRLVLDLLGKVWKVRWLGIGYSYFWGDHFNGWSVGADLRLKF